MLQPKPGDAVESRCSRCNDVTGHVIVVIVDHQIVKVECRACGAVHRYRPPLGGGRSADAQTPAASRIARGTDRRTATRTVRAATAAALSGLERHSAPSAGRTTGTRAARAAAELEREWEKAIALAPGMTGRAYSMLERFEKDEVIEHSVFGSGIVREVIPPDKVRVLFRDGLRLLRCGG